MFSVEHLSLISIAISLFPVQASAMASDAQVEAAYILTISIGHDLDQKAGPIKHNQIISQQSGGNDSKTGGKTKTVDPPPNKATKGPEKSGPGPDPAKLKAQPEPQLNPQPLPPERGNNE